jgi:hypothetical protein
MTDKLSVAMQIAERVHALAQEQKRYCQKLCTGSRRTLG